MQPSAEAAKELNGHVSINSNETTTRRKEIGLKLHKYGQDS